jgi:hypothetical protein
VSRRQTKRREKEEEVDEPMKRYPLKFFEAPTMGSLDLSSAAIAAGKDLLTREEKTAA